MWVSECGRLLIIFPTDTNPLSDNPMIITLFTCPSDSRDDPQLAYYGAPLFCHVYECLGRCFTFSRPPPHPGRPIRPVPPPHVLANSAQLQQCSKQCMWAWWACTYTPMVNSDSGGGGGGLCACIPSDMHAGMVARPYTPAGPTTSW